MEKIVWNRKKILVVLLGAALMLCALILAISEGGDRGVPVKTNEERVMFLKDLGWEVDAQPAAIANVTIPMDFSDVYKKFNELQVEQGYDLAEHQGEAATIYAYHVLNYTAYDGSVVAELYIANDRIIGGDVHSLALDGFMHGLKRRSQT